MVAAGSQPEYGFPALASWSGGIRPDLPADAGRKGWEGPATGPSLCKTGACYLGASTGMPIIGQMK